MLFFKKNKIKLSIIEDYIQLLVIDNFFKNDFSTLEEGLNKDLFLKTKNLHKELLFNFNQTLEILKMNDLSLLILKKDLKDANHIYLKEKNSNFSTLNSTLKDINTKLKLLSLNLEKKQKELNLVPFQTVV